jgi:hypothetical protein
LPIAPALEWRLVTVTGTVEFVHRDGDAWRAELTLNGGGVPVVGLARSGIASTALEAGRAATITGIVKRAYPTATDQRLTIVPRTAADIRLGAAQPSDRPGSPTGRPGSSTPRPDASERPTDSAGHEAAGSPSPGPPAPAAGDVPLGELAAYQGATVRIGGLVTRVDGARLTVVDSSGSATIELTGEAAAVAATIAPNDLVNATGMVAGAGDSLRLVVDDQAGLTRLAARVAATPPDGLSLAPPVANEPASTGSGGGQVPAQSAPLLALLAILGVSLVLVIGAVAVKLGWLDRLAVRRRRI